MILSRARVQRVCFQIVPPARVNGLVDPLQAVHKQRALTRVQSRGRWSLESRMGTYQVKGQDRYSIYYIPFIAFGPGKSSTTFF